MNDRASSTQPARQEQRVSVVIGDRLCIECGYNLTGQPVLREPHYDMLIIRCPECSTVASAQEYPLLGRWAGRWAALAAALWFLIILGMCVACAGALFGLSIATSELASQELIEPINAAFQFNLAAPAATAPSKASGRPSFTSFELWWSTVDANQLVADGGGWSKVIRWSAFYTWIPLAAVAFAFGCFWSIALLNLRRWRVVIWCAVVVGLAGVFAIVAITELRSQILHSAAGAARQTLDPPILIASLVFAAFVMAIGALVGRSIIRTMVRALLPPRLCSSLALLWTADDLNPPTRGTPGASRSRR